MTAVCAEGHWRRRDALEGLSPRMRAALWEAEIGRLELCHGAYSVNHGNDAFHPTTIRALAERGLLQFSGGTHGRDNAYRLAARGVSVVAKMRRRAQVRAKLEA